MTTPAIPSSEAKDVSPEEAVSTLLNSTPESDSTVHGEEEGQENNNSEQTPSPEELALDELKYSERHLTAAREAALEEGKTLSQTEIDTNRQERMDRLASLVKETGGDPAPVIRNVKEALKVLGPDLTDEDLEPALKVVRDARATIEDAAMIVAAESYVESINVALGDKAPAFWEKARGIDPTLDTGRVLRLVTEELALESQAVKNADPEVLLRANAKLRANREEYGDTKFAAGRGQGRRDPLGEPSSEGTHTTPAPNSYPRDKDGNIDVAAALAKIS